MDSEVEVDVLVVGGGFSGLMAAYNTQEAGLKTIVLEAKHRVGGRSHSHELVNGGITELGATWINKTTQPEIYSLVKKFGLETSEQYTGGEVILQAQDGPISRLPDDGSLGDLDPAVLEKVERLFTSIEDAASKFNIHNWEEIPREKDISFAEWATQEGLYDDPFVQAQCAHLTNALVGLGPDQVGVQYLVDWVRSCGGWESIGGDGELGAQNLKIKQGTSSIATNLANAMAPGTVQLNTPVASITQYEHSPGCLVTTSTGGKYKAKKVILAIPTTTYDKIHFSPPLPHGKRVIMSHATPGQFTKVILTYRRPWWREAGLVGKLTSLLGPITVGYDVCGSEGQHYSLAVFLTGESAADWHKIENQIQRQDAAIEHLAQLFGPDLAANARDVLEYTQMEWTKEDYILACPVTGIAPGILSSHGKALREAFGSIHVAGGETAYEWKGYLEGAILAGQRASNEVVHALQEQAKL